MAVPAFDTSRFHETLAEAGVVPNHARAILRAVSDAVEHLPSADALAAFKADVRAEIADVRTEIGAVRAEVARSLTDQTWKLAQLVFGAVVLNIVAMASIAIALWNALR